MNSTAFTSHNAEVLDVVPARHLHCPIYPPPLVWLPYREGATFNGRTVARYEAQCDCGAYLVVEATAVSQTAEDGS